MSEKDDLQRRQKEAEERKKKEAEESKQRIEQAQKAAEVRMASDSEKTNELLAYCRDTFTGVEVNTNKLVVSTTPKSIYHNIEPDGVEWVNIGYSFWFDAGPTLPIPIMLCRYCGGRYECAIGMGYRQTFTGDFAAFKDFLKDTIADMGQPEIVQLHRKVLEFARHRR